MNWPKVMCRKLGHKESKRTTGNGYVVECARCGRWLEARLSQRGGPIGTPPWDLVEVLGRDGTVRNVFRGEAEYEARLAEARAGWEAYRAGRLEA